MPEEAEMGSQRGTNIFYKNPEYLASLGQMLKNKLPHGENVRYLRQESVSTVSCVWKTMLVQTAQTTLAVQTKRAQARPAQEPPRQAKGS